MNRTVKELSKWLKQFPNDSEVYTEISTGGKVTCITVQGEYDTKAYRFYTAYPNDDQKKKE